MRWLRLLPLLVLFCSEPAWAGPPLNAQPNIRVAEFATNPTAVTVDVVDLGGSTQVANDVAATQVTRDSDDAAQWTYDLSAVTGYPTACEVKTYLVTFVPDAADCSDDGSPDLCASDIVQVGGSACPSLNALMASPGNVHTSSIVSGQGITQKVLDFYNRRGILPIKWQKIPLDGGLSFGSPDLTVWLVYFYTDTGDAPRLRCVVPSTSDPSVSLPSATHCPSG